MARPSKLTPETLEKIIKAIRGGATYELAAAFAGISYETFNEWRKTKPQFSEALREAEGEAALVWLAKIEQAAASGDWRAAAWKLERRYPRDYGRSVQEQQHSGGVSINITRRPPVEYVKDWRQGRRPGEVMVEEGRTGKVDEEDDALTEP